MTNLNKHKHITVLAIPFIGMFLFLAFYIMAAFLYPGGSYKDPQSTNFSFLHNYLCDLLDTYAINSELNSASTLARVAFGILCITLIFIWYQIPRLFKPQSFNLIIIRISGITAMLIVMFLASGVHDTIVYIAGFFGIIAFIATFIELYKHGFYGLFLTGIFCLFIFLANYYIYESGFLRDALPVIQKVTFVCCISWFLMLSVNTYQKLDALEKENSKRY